MNVYVLFHADIEDDRYVRGVYATAEEAQARLAVPDVIDRWVIERAAKARMRDGEVPAGHKPPGTHTWTHNGVTRSRATEEVWNFPYERTHDVWCCSVDEMPLIGS